MRETRKRIVEAAYRCFSRKGFLGSTTKEIAREAGVSEVTLFRYFRSKEELFEEVLKSYSVLPNLKKLKGKRGKEEALRELAKEILNSLKERKEFLKILLSEVSSSQNSQKVEEVYRNFARILEGEIKEILGGKRLRAKLFFGALFGLFISQELFLKEEIKGEFRKELLDEILSLFLGERGEKGS